MEIHTPLPDQQAGSFKRYIQSLVEKFHPLQVFCFAKSKVSSETLGCFQDRRNTQYCDYCLLMVTDSCTRIDHEVQEFSNVHYHHGKITIISHCREAVQEAISANNRFFMTVYSTGQNLYSYDGMSPFDFNRKFIPLQSEQKAQKHFDHRLPIAEGFLRGASECLTKGDFTVATFLLHQVVEQCSILLIRVHLSYRSEIHNLSRLLRLCTAFSERPIQTFITGRKEDERQFNLLLKSYSESRYGNSFSVSAQDARDLYERVNTFIDLVKAMCILKIEELEHEALLYRELKEESEAHHE